MNISYFLLLICIFNYSQLSKADTTCKTGFIFKVSLGYCIPDIDDIFLHYAAEVSIQSGSWSDLSGNNKHASVSGTVSDGLEVHFCAGALQLARPPPSFPLTEPVNHEHSHNQAHRSPDSVVA